MKMKKTAALLLCLTLTAPAAHPAFAYAESIAEVSGESLAEDAAQAAPAAASGNALSEENAFSRTLDAISGAALDAYRSIYGSLDVDLDHVKLPAFRLSLEKDSLRLLDFAAESILKTDLDWIDEIGIDLIPTFQTVEGKNYNAAYSTYFGYSDEPLALPLPGMSAVLHLNGKEIVTADMLLDVQSRCIRTALPEIVSGSSYQDLSYAFSTLMDKTAYSSPTLVLSSMMKTFSDAGALLPSPELVQMLTDTIYELSGNYVPEKQEERILEAGSVKERCAWYTGSISMRDLASLLSLLLDRFENDADFRSVVLSYLDGFYELTADNSFLNSLVYQFGGSFRYAIMNLHRYPDYAAIMNGEWKYTDRYYERLSEWDAEDAESASDTDSTVETAGSTRWEIHLEPGRTYSAEEIRESGDYGSFNLGIMNGYIETTKEYSLGESLYLLYQDSGDELKNEIAEAVESIDEQLLLRITSCFDEQEKLKGLSLSCVEGSFETAAIQLGWPEDENGNGLALDIQSEEERVLSLSAEALPDTYRADIRLSGLLDAHAEYSVDAGTGRADLALSAKGDEFGAFSLTGSKVSEEESDIYTAQADYDGETVASAEGYVDHKSGDVDFQLRIPEDSQTELTAALSGNYDARSGKGSYKLSILEGRTEIAYIQGEQLSLLIDTDRLRLKKDGSLSGSIAVSQTGSSSVRSPIPKGLKLIMDFGKNSLKIADGSATYLTFQMTESAILSQKDAKARIRSAWSEAITGRLGNNWNAAYILNRLMQAGMPSDLLKNLPLTMEEIGDAVEEIRYAISDLLYDLF